MRTLLRWLVAILVCVAVVSVLGTVKYLEITAAIAAQEAQPEYSETVESFTPETVSYTPTVKSLGVVVAPQQVTLRNELAGYITEVSFRSGASVGRGQTILQLDVSEQEANLASAQARARLAQAVYDRDLGLRESDAVSQETLERSRAELNVVTAEIAAINSIIHRKTIRAPFDGTIGIHRFEPGQYLDANTPITTIVGRNEQMWVDFSIPQFYGELAVGTIVRVRVVRSRRTAQDQFYDATVIAGDSSIASGSRSRLYRAVLPNKEAIQHNAAVEVVAPVGTARRLLAVPTQSVRSGAEGPCVFVLDPDPGSSAYRARRAPVAIEGERGDVVYVAGEVQPEDLLAAAGSFKLRDGLLVYVADRPAVAGGR